MNEKHCPVCSAFIATSGECTKCARGFVPRDESSARRAFSAPLPSNARAYFMSRTRVGSGCWQWLGPKNCYGYGTAKMFNVRRMAHRLAYELFRGEIPEGKCLDHVCRKRDCVNPEHLRVVTNRENLFAPRSQSPAKVNSEKTHCPRGHEYTPENTFHAKGLRGGRVCRTCRHDRWKREKVQAIEREMGGGR
jgi:hypothetical protein